MIVLPREGLEHPVFAKVALEDFLEVRVRWGEPLDDEKLGQLTRRIRDFSRYDWGAHGAKKRFFGLGRPAPSYFSPAGTPTSCVVTLSGVDSAACSGTKRRTTTIFPRASCPASSSMPSSLSTRP